MWFSTQELDVIAQQAALDRDVDRLGGHELELMAQDAHGSRELERLLRCAQPLQRERLLALLLPRVPALSRSSHGARVAASVVALSGAAGRRASGRRGRSART